ncbi:hypothetical protein [Phocaeicola sp.]
MNLKTLLPAINEELSKFPCPTHHNIIHATVKYNKITYENVCCKEHELACSKVIATLLLQNAQEKKIVSYKRKI